MDTIEAITTRKSIRAFKNYPVPKRVLMKVIEVSLRAPSFGNSQPWEFALIGGDVMAELKSNLAQNVIAGKSPNPDMPEATFSEEYLGRIKQSGKRLFELLNISREDKHKRSQWAQTQARAFDAPNGLIIYIDRQLPAWSILDVGIVIQTIILTAHEYGLGTCVQAALAQYPDILRKILNIPETKLIVCGIAIGYPDPGALVNQFISDRLPLNTFVKWHGFN